MGNKIRFKDRESKLVLNNILFSIIFKGGSLLISLACTKQYIIYFNDDMILGAWFAIVSILNWILYFDLGIGNGLRNGIVIPLEKNDYETLKKYISTGYISILGISVIIIIIGVAISNLLDWNSILNLPKSKMECNILLYMVCISIVGVGTQFFLKVIVSIYQAMRKTAIFGLTALVTNVIIFIYLKFASPENQVEALTNFAIVYAFATNLPFLIVSIITFCGKLKKARPSLKYYDRTISKNIMSLGIKFFAIQVALLIISSLDSWLITYFFEPENSVSYQIYYRFFSIALTVYALFSQTTWSSVTKYAGEHNGKQIKKIYKFLNFIALLGTVACIILAFSFKLVVKIWMGDLNIEISTTTALLFAMWMMMHMIINASTAVANGMGQLKCQTLFIPLAGIIKIVGVVIASNLGFDWTSVLVCNIISLIPIAIAQHLENIKQSNKLL